MANSWRQIELASVLANFFTIFFFGKLLPEWPVSDEQTCWWLSTNQNTISNRMIYLLNTTQNGRRNWILKSFRGSQLSGCVERFIFSIKETKSNWKENRGARGQTGFRWNLFISPTLSVSSFFFFCFIVLLSATALKSAVWQITLCCDLTRFWRIANSLPARWGGGGGGGVGKQIRWAKRAAKVRIPRIGNSKLFFFKSQPVLHKLESDSHFSIVFVSWIPVPVHKIPFPSL